jgi:hypothetical protein
LKIQEHSLDEEISMLHKSPDCRVANAKGDCFAPLNTSSHSSIVVVHRLAKKHGLVLEARNIDQFNRSGSNIDIAVDPKGLFAHSHHNTHLLHHHTTTNINNNNHSATTTSVLGPPTSSISNLSAQHLKYVIPLQLFVASDDVNVLHSAAREGHLTSIVGKIVLRWLLMTVYSVCL